MQRVFQVKYKTEVHHGKGRPATSMGTETKTVLTNGSAEKAISKVKKTILAEGWTDKDEDTGKRVHHQIKNFQVIGVEQITEVDIP